MRGLFKFLFQIVKVLIKIFIAFLVVGGISYIVIIKYTDYKIRALEEQEEIRHEESEKASAEFKKQKEAEQKLIGDKEKVDAFTACMNKAYKEYTENWNSACAELKKSDECSLTPEKLWEVQDYYKSSKKDCEKLKK